MCTWPDLSSSPVKTTNDSASFDHFGQSSVFRVSGVVVVVVVDVVVVTAVVVVGVVVVDVVIVVVVVVLVVVVVPGF